LRFVKRKAIVDEILFCQDVKERARVKDFFNLLDAFLRENSLPREKLGWVCATLRPLWWSTNQVL